MHSNVKFAGIIGAALLLVVLVFASFFTVGQNELTVVNRFGSFVMSRDQGCISKYR